MIEALPLIIAREAKAPAGKAVKWYISGEPDTNVTVRVDDEGRGQLSPESGIPHPDVTISMSLEGLQLLFCGRRESQAVTVNVQGDAHLAERVISALPVTP